MGGSSDPLLGKWATKKPMMLNFHDCQEGAHTIMFSTARNSGSFFFILVFTFCILVYFKCHWLQNSACLWLAQCVDIIESKSKLSFVALMLFRQNMKCLLNVNKYAKELTRETRCSVYILSLAFILAVQTAVTFWRATHRCARWCPIIRLALSQLDFDIFVWKAKT